MLLGEIREATLQPTIRTLFHTERILDDWRLGDQMGITFVYSLGRRGCGLVGGVCGLFIICCCCRRCWRRRRCGRVPGSGCGCRRRSCCCRRGCPCPRLRPRPCRRAVVVVVVAGLLLLQLLPLLMLLLPLHSHLLKVVVLPPADRASFSGLS